MKIVLELECAEITEAVLYAIRLLGSPQAHQAEIVEAPDHSALMRGKVQAEGLVEAWNEGWGGEEPVDRSALLNRYLSGVEGGELLLYLRSNGTSGRNLREAGASEEMAGNIIAVGAAARLWATT